MWSIQSQKLALKCVSPADEGPTLETLDFTFHAYQQYTQPFSISRFVSQHCLRSTLATFIGQPNLFICGHFHAEYHRWPLEKHKHEFPRLSFSAKCPNITIFPLKYVFQGRTGQLGSPGKMPFEAGPSRTLCISYTTVSTVVKNQSGCQSVKKNDLLLKAFSKRNSSCYACQYPWRENDSNEFQYFIWVLEHLAVKYSHRQMLNYWRRSYKIFDDKPRRQLDLS